MREFDCFTDLTGKDRELGCFYHGDSKKRFEGRILTESDLEMRVGVNLWSEDITTNQYDAERGSLDIWYKHFEGVRIRIAKETTFLVPKDIKEINVYDVEQDVQDERDEQVRILPLIVENPLYKK